MSDADEQPRDLFKRLAPKWSQYDCPLRPTSEDTAMMQQAADALPEDAAVAVLGLTPEIVACRWPERSFLCATDHSAAMLRMLWPPDRVPANAAALRADWLRMPLASASTDMIAGDGCYAIFPPQGGLDFLAEMRRVLRPGGTLVLRTYLRREREETLADAASDLAAGRISGVHALKLRLWGVLHGPIGSGILLADVWRAWKSMPSLPPALRNVRGWTEEELATIEGYRDLQVRYYLPTLAEFRRQTAPYFREVKYGVGGYEYAERCPTFVFIRD